MQKLKRKNIRLSKEVYATPNQMFSITICTKDRRPLFTNHQWSKDVLETLRTGNFGQETECFAYCLMPDHLHLAIASKGENLIILLNQWKSYTANLLRKKGLEGGCWQRSFYDHALRKEEDIQAVAEYIVQNPARSGLVKEWKEYPFSWHKWMKAATVGCSTKTHQNQT
jgi:REP element-mobilizing transposase RayT